MTTSLTLRAEKGSALTHAEGDANLTALRTTADAALAASDTLTANKAEAAALGVANTDQNMGSFTGTTISDNVSAKAAIQALETAVETKANASVVGVTAFAANMGTYTGTTIPDNETAKQNIQSLETAVELRATLAQLAASTGASLLGWIQSGAGSVARTIQAKLRDIAGPADFGAVEDGSTNDSAAFSSLITAKMNMMPAAGKSYSIKDITLSNSQSIVGIGQNVNASSSATNLFKLSDYNPKLHGIYISTATNCSGAAIKILASRYPMLSDIVAVNCGVGFMDFTVASPSTTASALPIISNCHAEGVTGTGVNISSSVSEIQLTNMHVYGQLTAGTGGDRPIFTTTGWRQNTPVSGGVAVGGHQIANVNMITFNRGFYLTDAQLSKFTNCIADSCSDYGVLLDGACDYINFSDLLVGTTRGIKIAGTSAHIHIDGLETILNGTIPPWGGTDFYNGVGTFYDLEVRNTANVRVSNWRGDKRIIVDSGAKLIVMDGENLHGKSVGTVAAATTTYLGVQGQSATETDVSWRAPYDCYILRLMPTVGAAPGAGNTFTYTARLNGADTALVATISGAGSFGGVDIWSGSHVSVDKGSTISIKLVTSASAVAAVHNCIMQIAPR